jgi:hypothetical protein
MWHRGLLGTAVLLAALTVAFWAGAWLMAALLLAGLGLHIGVAVADRLDRKRGEW